MQELAHLIHSGSTNVKTLNTFGTTSKFGNKLLSIWLLSCESYNSLPFSQRDPAVYMSFYRL